MKPHEDSNACTTPSRRRELLLLRAGAQVFAVFADQAEDVAEGLRPAPLPHAPRAVVGVVCVRGRMFTALDPVALFDAQAGNEGVTTAAAGAERATPRFFVALGDDEQLALAVDRVEGKLEAEVEALVAPEAPAASESLTASESLAASERAASPLLALLEHEGARVLVLDTTKLFDAATRGSERRRQRSVNAEP